MKSRSSFLFLAALISAAANLLALVMGDGALAEPGVYLAYNSMDDDEEDDEEEEAVNYRDRVREVQQWMNNRRGVTRDQGQGSEGAAPPRLLEPPSNYFEDHGYDQQGYRRLDRDFRVRLRDAPHHSYRYSYRRHGHGHRHWRKHSYRSGHHPYNRHGSRHGRRRYSANPSRHHAPSHAAAGARHYHKGSHSAGRRAKSSASSRHTKVRSASHQSKSVKRSGKSRQIRRR